MHNLSNYIRVYDDVLPKETCDYLIKSFEEEKIKQNNQYLRHSDFSWQNDYRSFLELNISQTESYKDFMPKYYSRTKQIYDHYKSIVGTDFFPQKFAFEDARLKKYEANDYDQFGWHIDVGDKASASRYLVMFTYLNDVEVGGETQFEGELDYTVKPVCGRMVVFPPMWMFAHRGKKPISCPKYILSTYLHYV